MVGVFERVYEVGPVFRAEPHDTARHINEYVSLDAEVGFIENEYSVMAVLTDTIASMLAAVERDAAGALALLGLELPKVPQPIPDVHFLDAQAMITAATGEDLSNEPDLSPANERWLGEWAKREHGSDFLFVRGFPMSKRPFYTHPDPERPGFAAGFDLLFRGMELVTGGQRLHRYQDYVDALVGRGEDPENYAAYLMAFKHGMPPHGGFAIGLERWVAQARGRLQRPRDDPLPPGSQPPLSLAGAGVTRWRCGRRARWPPRRCGGRRAGLPVAGCGGGPRRSPSCGRSVGRGAGSPPPGWRGWAGASAGG